MPTSPSYSFDFPPIPDVIRSLGLWLSKDRGQHFLRSHGRCSQIADLARLSRAHMVVEVGAGLGNLSIALARRAGEVVSVEIDRDFEPWHKKLSAVCPGLTFLYNDFLEVNLEELTAGARRNNVPVVLAGNLPYQITSPVLFRAVDQPFQFDSIVAMMQREVAERIVAGAGQRGSGALGVKLAMRYEARIAFDLPPDEFFPPPAVRSSVVVLTPIAKEPLPQPEQRRRVFRLVDGVFTHRRKTLPNCLMEGGVVPTKDAAMDAVVRAGIDPKRRPETLSIPEFLKLAECIAP